MKSIKFFRYLALLLIPIGISLVLIELVLRVYLSHNIFYDVEMSRYGQSFKMKSTNPRIGHVHRPGAEGRLMNVQVNINADGLRDREYSIERDRHSRRIIFLGDSLTFGWGVEEPEIFATILERRLSKDRPTEIINFGTGNYNTTQEVSLFLNKGLKYNPDAVVLFYFINDAEPIPKKSAFAFLANFRLTTFYWSRFKKLQARWFSGKTFKEYYADLYHDTQPGWIETRESLLKLAQISRQRDIDLQVVILPELHNLVEYTFAQQHEQIIGFLEANDIEVLNLAPMLNEQTDPHALWVALDDAHPNARAHRLIADHSEDFIKRKIR